MLDELICKLWDETGYYDYVGGLPAGRQRINTMVANKLTGVEFIAANTDMQALNMSLAPRRLQLGSGVTKGLGAGADPDRGREAAQESYEELLGILDGANMVFITAGLGGGTGTGALPVIARACKEVGALTVAVVSKPFCFEGKKRMKNAEAGWDALREHADTIITVPNDRLLTMMNKNSTMSEMLINFIWRFDITLSFYVIPQRFRNDKRILQAGNITIDRAPRKS